MVRTIAFSTALLLASVSTAMAQSPLEELERRLDRGVLTPRQPGYLGLTADDRDTASRGLRVAQVRPGSPAEVAGVRVGDRVVEIARRPVRSLDDMSNVLRFYSAGESVDITLERGGERHLVTARLAVRPPTTTEELPPPGEPPPPSAATPPARLEEPLPPPTADSTEPSGGAATEELETLRRETTELRRRLETLERRLEELQERLSP